MTDLQASPPNDPMGLVLRRRAESYAKGILDMWTVYYHPNDFPDEIVARRFTANPEGPTPTDDMISGTIDEIRLTFDRAGLICMARHAADEAKIVETWV